MLNFVFGFMLLSQLQLAGGIELPQIVEPKYSGRAVKAGSTATVEVSLAVRDGFLINRIPQMQLVLEPVDGVALAETTLLSPTEDPKSTDSYYVDVPGFTVSLRAARTGTFEIPGELVYFFCSKADGYCARQTADVKIPVRAE